MTVLGGWFPKYSSLFRHVRFVRGQPIPDRGASRREGPSLGVPPHGLVPWGRVDTDVGIYKSGEVCRFSAVLPRRSGGRSRSCLMPRLGRPTIPIVGRPARLHREAPVVSPWKRIRGRSRNVLVPCLRRDYALTSTYGQLAWPCPAGCLVAIKSCS